MLCGELGEDLILKIGEVILFTEKKRVIGSELVQHQLQVRRITGGKQMLQKGAEILIAQLPQRMGETAADQLALFAQVDAVILLDELDQSVEVGVRYGKVMGKYIQDNTFYFPGIRYGSGSEGSQRPAWSVRPPGSTCRRPCPGCSAPERGEWRISQCPSFSVRYPPECPPWCR